MKILNTTRSTRTVYIPAIFLSLLFASQTSQIVSAATPSTASATPTKTTTATASGDLVNQIKNMVKENLDATVSNLEQKVNLKSLVGLVGTIESISAGNITVESEGNLLQVTTTDKTVITKSGAASKITALAISDKVIIIGTMIKDDIIQAKALKVFVPEIDVVETDALVAPVYSVDVKKKTIILTINKTQVPYTLSKKNTVEIDKIKPNQTVFVVTKKYQGKDSISRAKII